MINIQNIRNFSIIAHIDHGKSTLADRLIEKTGSLDKREMKEQVLDSLEVERKHGITVKAQAVRMEYTYNGVLYELNMIDTPGHADFSYEVSKSLSACEGALLVVNYRGVLCLVRVFEGSIRKGDEILIFSNKKEYTVEDLNVLTPKPKGVEALYAGEVGILISSIKNIEDVLVGDTVTLTANPAKQALKGFKKVKPFVYAGIYPTDTDKYDDLKDGLEKLKLNDSSLEIETEKSDSLGFGFRCGFLGMLHMNITKERLEEEFGLDIVVSLPSVLYKVEKTDGSVVEVSNPKDLPEPQFIKAILEPYVSIDVITPSEYIGSVLRLLQERRGIQKNLSYLSENRSLITYSLPLSETITDFYDTIKSITRGYASFNYEFEDYKRSDLVKMIILINNEPIDSFSQIVHKESKEAFMKLLEPTKK